MGRLLIIVLLFFSRNLVAEIYEYGYSPYEEESKQRALENLSKKLEVESRKRGYDRYVYALDKLPVLKPTYFIRINKNGYETKIELGDSSIELYRKRINQLQKEAEDLRQTVQFIKEDRLRLEMYEELYSLYSILDRYYALVNLVYKQNRRLHTVEKKELERKIFAIKSEVYSRAYAIDKLSGFFKQKLTFVYPVTVFGSQTPSDYGIDFSERFSKRIHKTEDIDLAKYLLIGRYVYKENKVLMQLLLLDKTTYDIIRLKTLSYRDDNIRIKNTLPRNFKLEPILFSGYEKNDFDLYIKSEKGSCDLVFKKKKRAKFYLKSKANGYLFVIGYYNLPHKKIAYLAQLNNKKGNAKFVKRVHNGGYVKIADFEVKPPLGTRSYQLFVTDNAPVLPQTKYNRKYRVYEIGTNDIVRFAGDIKSYQFNQKRYKSVAYAAISFVTLESEEEGDYR